MAKQGMIQRERKRERLRIKHIAKREAIKQDLKQAGSFSERLVLYKKMEQSLLGAMSIMEVQYQLFLQVSMEQPMSHRYSQPIQRLPLFDLMDQL